jgi:hypothetical protein
MLDSTICIRFRGARGGRKFKQATSVARSPLVSAQLVDSMRFAYNKKAAKLPSERSTENSFRKNESFYGWKFCVLLWIGRDDEVTQKRLARSNSANAFEALHCVRLYDDEWHLHIGGT